MDPLGQGLVGPAGRGAARRNLQAAASSFGRFFFVFFFFFFFLSFELGLRLDDRRAQGRADVPDGRDPAARGGVGAFFFFRFCVYFFFLLSLSSLQKATKRKKKRNLTTFFSPLFLSSNYSLSLSVIFSQQQEAWLDLAAGLLPTDCVASAACHEPHTHSAQTAAKGAGGDKKSAAAALATLLERNCPRDRQHLFSLYVHTPKGVDFLEVCERQRDGFFC